MGMAISGTISLGGSTASRSVNLELGVSSTTQRSLGDSSSRSLAGIASGPISLSNFYGKDRFTVYTNYVPYMNNDTNPSPYQCLGTWSTSSGSGIQYNLFKGFRDNSETWAYASNANAWLGIYIGTAKVFNRAYVCTGSQGGEPSSNFIIQGSNDGSNWTTLLGNTAFGNSTNTNRTFDFYNKTAYNRYRFYSYANYGAGWTSLRYLNFSYVNRVE